MQAVAALRQPIHLTLNVGQQPGLGLHGQRGADLLLLDGLLRHRAGIGDGGGQDHPPGNIQHTQGLDVDDLDVVFQLDLIAAVNLLRAEDLLPLEQVQILLVDVIGQCVHRAGQV